MYTFINYTYTARRGSRGTRTPQRWHRQTRRGRQFTAECIDDKLVTVTDSPTITVNNVDKNPSPQGFVTKLFADEQVATTACRQTLATKGLSTSTRSRWTKPVVSTGASSGVTAVGDPFGAGFGFGRRRRRLRSYGNFEIYFSKNLNFFLKF